MQVPDVHVGYSIDTPTHCIPAWDIFIQALKHMHKRVTHVVCMGDFGNFESVAHWASLRAEQAFLMEDTALVNTYLDEVEAITKPNGIKVVYLEGNHEAWAGQLEAKYPMLRDSVNLRRLLRIQERGWTWVPENYFWAIGELYHTHGHIRGARKPGDITKMKGVSVAKGHDHTYSTASVRTLTGELAEWSLGCLCNIDPAPPYCRSEPPARWVHGFGTTQVRDNGRFQLGYRRIIDTSWTELEDGTELIADMGACRRRYDRDQHIRDKLRADYGERYYLPGGPVVRTEPHHGKKNKDGDGTSVARNRRARIIRNIPEVTKGANL
jgi:hypothetical protein